MKKSYKLDLVRSTKNKHVYSDGATDVLGAVYIPKSELPEPPPAWITMTIEAGE